MICIVCPPTLFLIVHPLASCLGMIWRDKLLHCLSHSYEVTCWLRKYAYFNLGRRDTTALWYRILPSLYIWIVRITKFQLSTNLIFLFQGMSVNVVEEATRNYRPAIGKQFSVKGIKLHDLLKPFRI